MKYILDTDIIIYFLKGDKDIVSTFISSNADMLFTTRINYAELPLGWKLRHMPYGSYGKELFEDILMSAGF